MFFGDGGIFLALGFVACRRQPGKIWRSIVTAAAQEHCAAQNNRWALRTRLPKQHRHDAAKEIVGDDDVGWEIPKDLQETLVLRPHWVDQHTFTIEQRHFDPWRNVREFGIHSKDVS